MFNLVWNLKAHGGIYFGFKLHFPVTCVFNDGTRRRFVNMSLGFGAFTVGVDFVGRPQLEGGK